MYGGCIAVQVQYFMYFVTKCVFHLCYCRIQTLIPHIKNLPLYLMRYGIYPNSLCYTSYLLKILILPWHLLDIWHNAVVLSVQLFYSLSEMIEQNVPHVSSKYWILNRIFCNFETLVDLYLNFKSSLALWMLHTKKISMNPLHCQYRKYLIETFDIS